MVGGSWYYWLLSVDLSDETRLIRVFFLWISVRQSVRNVFGSLSTGFYEFSSSASRKIIKVNAILFSI